jgi:hypothetical protein
MVSTSVHLRFIRCPTSFLFFLFYLDSYFFIFYIRPHPNPLKAKAIFSNMPLSLKSVPRLLLSSLLFYSSFSRYTSGAYTPSYYAYQSARHSGDDFPIASGDALLSTLLLFQRTRLWTAVLAIGFFALPILQGLKERGLEGTVGDVVLFCLGAVVLGIETLY